MSGRQLEVALPHPARIRRPEAREGVEKWRERMRQIITSAAEIVIDCNCGNFSQNGNEEDLLRRRRRVSLYYVITHSLAAPSTGRRQADKKRSQGKKNKKQPILVKINF